MLDGKVAVVTGASRGIGRAIALSLAVQAAKVVSSARNEDALNALVTSIKAQGGVAIAVVGNVAVSADADNLIEAAVKALGTVHIVRGLPAIRSCGQGFPGRAFWVV